MSQEHAHTLTLMPTENLHPHLLHLSFPFSSHSNKLFLWFFHTHSILLALSFSLNKTHTTHNTPILRFSLLPTTLNLSLSFLNTFFIHFLSLFLSTILSHILSPSQIQTHTLSLCLTLKHYTHTLSHTHTLSLSLSLTFKHTLSLYHSFSPKFEQFRFDNFEPKASSQQKSEASEASKALLFSRISKAA